MRRAGRGGAGAGAGVAVAGAVVTALVAGPPWQARAVGLDGAAGASQRLGAAVGLGWDQVGGYGRDAYPFVELAAHAEARVWRRLAVGVAFTARGDLGNYNFALERWRRPSAGTFAQLTAGYDGPRLHVSGGPWLYGEGRDGRAFRVAVMYGVLRVRVGSLDGWHFALRLLDGAPFTGEGSGTGLRLLLGAPPRGPHRLQAGVYTGLLEGTAGLTAIDEIAGVLGHNAALRIGLLLGTDLAHPTRPELSTFIGATW